jgi:hypothetical protein
MAQADMHRRTTINNTSLRPLCALRETNKEPTSLLKHANMLDLEGKGTKLLEFNQQAE